MIWHKRFSYAVVLLDDFFMILKGNNLLEDYIYLNCYEALQNYAKVCKIYPSNNTTLLPNKTNIYTSRTMYLKSIYSKEH